MNGVFDSNCNHFYCYSKSIRPKPVLFITTFTLTLLSAIFYSDKSYLSIFHTLLFFACLFALHKTLFRICEESLLVIPSVGIQVRSKHWIGTKSMKFIAEDDIEDVIINEAFRMIHYLAVLKRQECGSNRLVPILLESKLRLHELKQIYQNIQKIL